MTLFSSKEFKSAQNILISRLNINPEEFTTTEIIHNYWQEHNMHAIATRVENKDATNSLTVRLHARNNTARVVPPSGAITINEWFDIIFVTPHGTTGTGTIQTELVEDSDARRSS